MNPMDAIVMDATVLATFHEFLDQLTGQSEANRYNYTRRLWPFIEANQDTRLAQITRVEVNAFIAQLNARSYAEATMSGYRQALKAFFNYCVRRGYLSRSPADHIKTGSFLSRRRKLPPEPDVVCITALAEQWLKTDHPRQVRDALIWLICEQSGPRQREIGELKKTEVEYALRAGPDNHGIYRVVSRGKTKEVFIRFGEHIAAGLRKWLQLRPPSSLDRCFITVRKTITASDPTYRYRALSRSATTHLLENLAAAAGVDKAVFSHALRHRRGTQTTRQHDAKLAAMILNHRDWQSAKTAMAYYYHPGEDDVSVVLASTHTHSELVELDKFFGVRRGK